MNDTSRAATLKDIKPGTRLILERQTIYDNHGQVPSNKVSVKTVDSIQSNDGGHGPDVIIRFKGVKHPRFSFLRAFGGYVTGDGKLVTISTSQPKPLRYDVHGIEG